MTNDSKARSADVKAEVGRLPFVRLTVELSPTHAAELAILLGNHVSFADFPWAEAICNALCSEGLLYKDVFRNTGSGEDAFLERKQD